MFLVIIFCVTLKNSPYILINVFKIPTFFYRQQNWSLSSIFADGTNGTCHIDATMDILVISNKVQGHNWFFLAEPSLLSSSSLRVFSISPQPPSTLHTHPQPPPYSPPSTCSDMFSLLSLPGHPLLSHAVREPFKLQVTTTVRTRSELKLEFLWVKFWVKVNYAPALYWKLLKCHWWHLCGMLRLSGQWK